MVKNVLRQTSGAVIFILIGIIIFGFALRIWNITGPDMVGDDAHYSFRALGYFDYVASENMQSTPVTWFPEAVWWQKLSFHDHPPLVFLIQFIFFQLLGTSLFVARLPFLLAGTLAIYAIFLLGRELGGERTGLIAAAFMAVANYAVWLSRFAYLDIFPMLWSILAIYFFLRARKNTSFYIVFWACLAAGLLSKLTFSFMLPVFLLAIFLYRRDIWREPYFYVGLALFLVMISPYLIYNLMMWQTRGHFDLVVSNALGLRVGDFKGINRTVAEGGFNPWGFIVVIWRNMSLGLQIVSYAALALVAYLGLKEKEYRNYYFIFGSLGFAMLMLYATGIGDKYAVVLLPFLLLAVGLSVDRLWPILPQSVRAAVAVVLGATFLWESVFAAQSQLMPAPVVANRFLVANNVPVWQGNNQLDDFVNKFYEKYPEQSYVIFHKNPQVKAFQVPYLQNILRQPQHSPQQKHLLIYDDRVNWYASMWIFERRYIYDVSALGKLSDFFNIFHQSGTTRLIDNGFEDATFIVAAPGYAGQNLTAKPTPIFADFFNKISRIKPSSHIFDLSGKPIFDVYTLSLKNIPDLID